MRRATCATGLRAGTTHVDCAFRGWSESWIDPEFRRWNITEELAYIRVPILIVQGAGDQYGTVRQLETAQEECYCPVEVALLPEAGHAPHREAPQATLDLVCRVRRPGCCATTAKARPSRPARERGTEGWGRHDGGVNYSA